MTPVAIGLRAQRGGSVALAVALNASEPAVVLSTFLPTAAEGDRLAYEPYHVAAGMPRDLNGRVSAEAAAVVAEGRARQARMATDGLRTIVSQLRDQNRAPALAALLVNRAGWITDLLEYSLGAPEHPPVAEGLAVRDALRCACQECGLPILEVDEKSLPDTATRELRLSPSDVDARLKAIGATAGKPWRKEQKLACLAAWLAAAGPTALQA